ncbi:UNVERIFIED_CONTAM: hypothetical protein Scaly_2578300 [Sesamum calycinum]|uniref:Gag-pol polyprotein n=1 Tax=Sesamum calycinum TaxID=2727403 RepID=A0AAW2JGS4_9LAMI
MSNDVQKQYDRRDDVASILQRMKEVYTIPDRHTRYVSTKEFFRAKMTEGSFVQEHWAKMLSLVEKLKDLKAGLDNDTYIDVILQSLPPSYDLFVVNFNMNGLEKSINELINILVLQRSRKLSKDEVVLRLGDGKAVVAEAVGIINLVISDRVSLELKDCYFVPSMIKNIISIPLLDNVDRMKRLVDSKSLEIENLDNLPACESCLKGKMTRMPFVGQSTLANGLLDLIHIDVCGSLNTQARGGLSYFITFIDDHSRYGYVYLMRFKSEAFVRFKEFRLEVEN